MQLRWTESYWTWKSPYCIGHKSGGRMEYKKQISLRRQSHIIMSNWVNFAAFIISKTFSPVWQEQAKGNTDWLDILYFWVFTVLKVPSPVSPMVRMQFDILGALVEVRLPGIAHDKPSRQKHTGSWALFHWHTLIIHYFIFPAWLADRLGMAASWTFLQSCLLECTFLRSFICPTCPAFAPLPFVSPPHKAKYSSLHRVVSSPPGHPGSVRFVDLILVWCCLSSSQGSNDRSAGPTRPLSVQPTDNTSPRSPPLRSDLKADEKRPQRGTHVCRWRFKIWHPAGWSGMEWSGASFQAERSTVELLRLVSKIKNRNKSSTCISLANDYWSGTKIHSPLTYSVHVISNLLSNAIGFCLLLRHATAWADASCITTLSPIIDAC